MADVSRREVLKQGLVGLATLGAGGLLLRANASPTESSGDLHDYPGIAPHPGDDVPLLAATRKPTEDNILGPYHRPGAPFRAKISPPLAPGKVLVVHGRVWGYDTKKPLVGAMLDIWQASAKGRYDNDDPSAPPAKGVYVYRARVTTDETGYYEFETVRPGNYLNGAEYRPSHIHYWVTMLHYDDLVTQLYFAGDPYNDKGDAFIKKSLIIETKDQGGYELGEFDIVLAKKFLQD